MRIGITELFIIVLVALALIKPNKLADYSTKIGKGLKIVKKSLEKVNDDVVEPMKEVTNPIVEPVNEIKEQLTDVTSSLDKAAKGGNSQ